MAKIPAAANKYLHVSPFSLSASVLRPPVGVGGLFLGSSRRGTLGPPKETSSRPGTLGWFRRRNARMIFGKIGGEITITNVTVSITATSAFVHDASTQLIYWPTLRGQSSDVSKIGIGSSRAPQIRHSLTSGFTGM